MNKQDDSARDTAEVYADATAAQLRAEIAGSPYRTTKAVATAANMNYTTLTRNVSGEVPIKLATLYSVLDLLEVPPGVFFSRVDERARRG